MTPLAVYRRMLEQRRKREGLPVCRGTWLLAPDGGEYRALEASAIRV